MPGDLSSDGFRRWAVYFAPAEDDPLWSLGCAWLGWGDGATRDPGGSVAVADLAAAEHDRIVAAPRHYGFHATLKPPFTLAAATDPAQLAGAVADLAAGIPSFDAPPLRLDRIGGFRCLTLSAGSPAMDALAAASVTRLDRFRAPPPPEELAKRRSAGLTAREEELLATWGYPYVLDRFRFHITLTGSLDPETGARIDPVLMHLFGPVVSGRPLPVRDLALFAEPGDGTPFRLVRRFPLAPPPAPR